MKKPAGGRLNLIELQQHAAQAWTSQDIDEGASPTLRELAETLTFLPGDGRIWLNDQRMVTLRR